MSHFADRLWDAVQKKGTPLCVGLDPRWDSLPDEVRTRHGNDSLDSVAAAFEEFCLAVLDVVAPLVPVVKPQSAFFEMCGPAGMTALQRVLRFIGKPDHATRPIELIDPDWRSLTERK